MFGAMSDPHFEFFIVDDTTCRRGKKSVYPYPHPHRQQITITTVQHHLYPGQKTA